MCLARIGCVTRVCRGPHAGVRTRRRPLGSRHGTSASTFRGRRLLPRRRQGERRRADLRGRCRPRGLRRDPEARPPSLPLAVARPLSPRQPLPPARRNPAREPIGGHARPERPIRPLVQRATPPQGSRLRPPVLVPGDRVRRAVQLDPRVHPLQPDPPWLRPSPRDLAVDVGARGRWDRFAWCRTTQTS